MEDSEGSADREMSKIEDSISYKINAIQQTWVGFLQQLANRDVIKGAADALLSLSEGITSLGPVGVVAGIGTLTAGIKALGKATDSNGEKIFSFGKKVRDALGVTTLQQSYMGGYADSLKGMTKKTIEASLANSQYNKTQKKQLLTMAGLTASTNVQLTSQEKLSADTSIAYMINEGYVKSEEELTSAKVQQAVTDGLLSKSEADLVTKKALSISLDKKQIGIFGSMKSKINDVYTAFTGMSTAMKTGSVILAAAVAAITAYIYIKNRQKKVIEETRKAAEEALSTYKEESSTIRKTTNDIKSIKDEYYKLAKGVDSFGNNISLSNENFERYNELSNQIADAMPELVGHWTNQGNAVLTIKDNVDSLNDSLDEYQKKAAYVLINGEIDEDGKKTGGAQAIIDNYQNQMNGPNGFIAQKKLYQSIFDNLEELRKYQDKLSKIKLNGTSLEEVFNDYPEMVDNIRQAVIALQDANDALGIDRPVIDLSQSNLDTILDEYRIVEKNALSGFAEVNDKIKEQNESVQELGNSYQIIIDKELNDTQKAAIQKIIGSLDEETLASLDTPKALNGYIDDIANIIINNPEISDAVVGIFSLDKSQTIKAAQESAKKYLSALKKALEEGNISQDLYDLLVGQTEWIDETAQTLNNAIKSALTSNPDLEKAKLALYKQTAEEESRTSVNQDLIDDQEYINDLKQEIEELKTERDRAKAERKKKYSESDMVGNVNLNDRPTVSGVDMDKAGWWGNSQTYSTVMTDGEFFDNPKDGTPWYVQYTPILPNGEVLTKQSCMDYIQSITEDASSAEDVLTRDSVSNGGKGILFGVFDSYTDKNGNVNKLQWDVNTEQAREIFQNEGEARHDNQADIYDKEGAAVEELTQKTLELDAAQKKYDEDLKNSSNGSDYYSQKLKEQESVVRDRASAENVLQDYMNSFGSAQEQQDFATYLNNLDKTISTEKEAKEAIRAFKAEATTKSEAFNLTDFSSTITQLEKIHTLYNTFAEKVENGESGLDLAADIKDVEALRAEFDDLDNIDFGDFKSFDDIEKVLTSGTASAKEMQSAFDQLATSLITAKLEEADYSKEEQDLIVTQLRQAGVTKESAQAYVDAISAIANAKKYLADNGIELSDITEDEIKQIVKEGDVSKETANGIMQLVAQEIAAGNTSLSTESSCNALLLLAEYCGVAVDSINDLKKALGGTAQSMATANITGMGGAGSDVTEKVSDKSIKTSEQARQYNIKLAADRIMQEAKKKMAEASAGLSLDGALSTGSKNSGGSGGSSTSDTDEYLEKYEEQYKRLGELRDNNKIDEYEYLQYLRGLYEKFFKDKEKYAEEYAKYEQEYLSGMKSLYEKVFSGLGSRIDKQITKLNNAKSAATSALNDQKTAAVDSLNAQKEAAVDAIEAQIDAIKKQQDAIQDQIDAYQDQIDAINDANDAREREIALQKALYDLDKMQNQRSNLVYSESQGMHYEADLSGIRDARESVNDAKDDIEIANIQKKIDLLEKQKDLLDDEIDKLEEQKDAIEEYYENLIDETEAYYDKLIEETEAAFDKQIDGFQKSKDMLEEFQNAVEEAQLNSLLKDLGISFDELIKKISDGDLSVLNNLGIQYASVCKEIYSSNQQMVDSLGEVFNTDMSKLPGYLEQTQKAFEGIQNIDFDIVKNGVEDIRNAFENLGNDSEVYELLGDHLSENFQKAALEGCDGLKVGFSEFFNDPSNNIDFISSYLDKIDTSSYSSVVDEKTKELGKYIAEGIGKGISEGDASSYNEDAIKTLADGIVEKSREIFEIGSPSELIARNVGVYAGQGVAKGMMDSLSGGETDDMINQFVTTFAQKLKEAFANSDLALMSDTDNSDTGFFQGFLDGLKQMIDQLGDIDTTPLVTLTSQFQDLQKAATDTASAIGGNGTTTQTMPTTGATGEANGTGNQNAAATTTGNSDSLVGAITALGSTADEVLGEGGEDGDGSGIVGQFQAMQKAVEETAIAIGSGDSEGSGNKGGDDSGVGLIAALEAEKEVAFDEEQGLPKQIELWEELEGGIQNCVDAVQRLIDGLSQLEEFSLSVNFAGFSVPAGAEFGSEATGTVTFGGYAFADGTNVGLESDQRALIGEVGEESLVRNGKFSLIGRNGAQFMDLKRGDIIFSHSQTKQLLKTGRINGRGKTVGNRAYADGTPLNKAFKFAGQDTTASNLSKLSAMLTGFVDTTNAAIEPISKVAQSIANSVPNVSNSNSSQSMTISIGDIHLSGVQNPDGLAQAIKSYLPGKLLQELHK